MIARSASAALVSVVFLFAAASARADDGRPAALAGVGFDQKLNDRVPLDLAFRDEGGRAVRLGDFFNRTPVILTLNYFDCPMLCPLELNDVLRAIRAIPLRIGTDYQIVTVSIDPHDTPERASAKHEWYVEQYGRSGGGRGWHFLVGDAGAIDKLANAAGFRFTFDSRSGQYAHASGIMVVTPDGRLAQYFLGLEYSARDLRLALVNAAGGRTGSVVDQILLFCFHYDPTAARYSVAIMRTVRAAAAATLGALAFAGVALFRRERVRPVAR
jgi:protein SCO1/2